MTKISVIIPVYNACEYLSRCLDSVCNQTLSDIEIICVNDCSQDSSLDILHEYSKKDSRIKVFNHLVNGGESKARNTGLKNANGEYIAFLDNDDTIDKDFYNKLYNKAISDNADICKAEVRYINYDGKITYGNINQQYKLTNNKVCFTLNWWTAIYRRDLVFDNNIKLLEGCILGGDSLFLNEAIIHSKKLSIVDGVYYNYYRREDSGDSKILNIEKLTSALNVFKLILDNTNNALKNNLITNVEYDYIFQHWCYSIILISMRNDNIECKKICAEIAVYFMDNCLRADNFKEFLLNKYPCLVDCLYSKNETLICNFLESNPNYNKFNLTNIRCKHLKTLEKAHV